MAEESESGRVRPSRRRRRKPTTTSPKGDAVPADEESASQPESLRAQEGTDAAASDVGPQAEEAAATEEISQVRPIAAEPNQDAPLHEAEDATTASERLDQAGSSQPGIVRHVTTDPTLSDTEEMNEMATEIATPSGYSAPPAPEAPAVTGPETAPANARYTQAQKLVRNYSLLNAGVGLVPMIVVDLLAAGAVQLMMVNRLCNLYGVEFSKERTKALISSLVGGVGTPMVVGSVAKMIPIGGYFGFAIPSAATTGAVTYAIGQVFVRDLELGGPLYDADPETMRSYFAEKVEEGRKMLAKAASFK